MKKKDWLEFDGKYKKNLFVIKQNLSEHLSAINENTSEIQGVFDYVQEVDQKIEKVAARLDQLQLDQQRENQQPIITPLNETERKVFLALYTEEKPLNSFELSEKSKVPISIVRDILTMVVQKGIPVKRNFENNQTYYHIDPQFKEWQAKEGILNLSLNSFLETPVQTKLKTYVG
tara:strand:- start:3280 stop:3804 length:525 start_codon:yes stop_codon:yes gene_type:complete